MKYKLIIVTCLLTAQTLVAQETKNLTLQEAVDLSIKNSKLLKLNEAKFLEATNNIKEAEERRLPDAGVSTSYMYLPVKPTIDIKSITSSNGGPSVNQVVLGSVSASLPVYSAGKLKYGIESA